MWFLWIVLVILLWIYMDCCILRHEGFEAIPGPKGIFLLGNSLQIIMDPGLYWIFYIHLLFKDLLNCCVLYITFK